MRFTLILPLALCACARTDLYYPPNGKEVVVDERGRVSRHHNRAVVLNGSDALGNTVVEVSRNGVRLTAAGGLDNSTSTGMGYRTLRYGIGAAATVAGAAVVASQAASAYGSEQAATATSNQAASRAAAATAVSNNATKVRLAEIAAQEAASQQAAAAAAAAASKAIPAAGSTIPSIIPSVVTPVP